MAVIYCYRSGHIEVGSREPDGSIALVRGPAAKLRDAVCACARHARRSDALFVPGVPEAPTDRAALDAAATWAKWLVTGRPGFTYLGVI